MMLEVEDTFIAVMVRGWRFRSRNVTCWPEFWIFRARLDIDIFVLRSIMKTELRIAGADILHEVIGCCLLIVAGGCLLVSAQFLYQAITPDSREWWHLPEWAAIVQVGVAGCTVSFCEWWRTCWRWKLIGIPRPAYIKDWQVFR